MEHNPLKGITGWKRKPYMKMMLAQSHYSAQITAAGRRRPTNSTDELLEYQGKSVTLTAHFSEIVNSNFGEISGN
jgi:hypothetical protein